MGRICLHDVEGRMGRLPSTPGAMTPCCCPLLNLLARLVP